MEANQIKVSNICREEYIREEIHTAVTPEICRTELLRTLGENSAAIIHELKGPLAGIRAQLQLLQRQIGLSGSNIPCDRFGLIYDEIERMNGLICEYLSLATPREPRLTQVDPAAMLRQISMLLRSLCLSNGVLLETDFPEQELQFMVDQQQIKQAVINLILNAMQACGCGGKIVIGLKNIKGEIIISVQDNGPGIDNFTMERLFDPFFTTKDSGNGLGLPIVRQIIEKHHGHIDVISLPNQGSCFSIAIPCLFDLSARREK